MNPKLGHTRSVIKRNYALITADGHVPSVFPGWTDCTPVAVISPALGARFSQFLIALDARSAGVGATGRDEYFFYVVTGKLKINAIALAEGGFAYLPPQAKYDIRGTAPETKLLVFKKTYEPIAGRKPPVFFTGHEKEISESPFLGDKDARLKTLIPDSTQVDLAVNIFTFEPGATLPSVETHVMEHGILFLAGNGVYRLGADWHPVAAGDAIWIAPYCPQWFIAAGPQPARYIYYKNVNREPA
jgi:(S)-ureidoglycine aminohydrolase